MACIVNGQGKGGSGLLDDEPELDCTNMGLKGLSRKTLVISAGGADPAAVFPEDTRCLVTADLSRSDKRTHRVFPINGRES